MQLLTALPMFAMNTPGNVITMNDKFNEIANFKIIEKEQLYDWVGVPIFGTETSEEKQIEAGVITSTNELLSEADPEATGDDEDVEEDSYLTSLFAGTTLIMNILLVILAIIFFVFLITLILLCRRCVNNKCCNCAKTILRKVEAKLMLNSVLRACLLYTSPSPRDA